VTASATFVAHYNKDAVDVYPNTLDYLGLHIHHQTVSVDDCEEQLNKKFEAFKFLMEPRHCRLIKHT